MDQDALTIADDIIELARSGLFDAAWYVETYGQIPAGGNPLVHFCDTGWRLGRQPNAYFDTSRYLDAHPDVRESGGNPLVHYLERGEAENHAPCAQFDPAAYRAAEHLAAGTSCLGHFLARRAAHDARSDADVIWESDLFDANHYLILYPDVRENGVDPLAHFCRHGWREGRRPNPYFDPQWYRKTYMAGAQGENPLRHYIETGERSGCRPIVYFDPLWYRREHPVGEGELALRHYLLHRRGQQVSPLQIFDVFGYVFRYGFLIGPNRDPFAHYLRAGISQDIDPGPRFNAKAYRNAHMAGLHMGDRTELHERYKREVLNPLVHYLLSRAR